MLSSIMVESRFPQLRLRRLEPPDLPVCEPAGCGLLDKAVSPRHPVTHFALNSGQLTVTWHLTGSRTNGRDARFGCRLTMNLTDEFAPRVDTAARPTSWSRYIGQQ